MGWFTKEITVPSWLFDAIKDGKNNASRSKLFDLLQNTESIVSRFDSNWNTEYTQGHKKELREIRRLWDFWEKEGKIMIKRGL